MRDRKGGPALPVPPVSTVREIPLYLIPRVVADQIKEKRETVFQIMVTRTNHHYYNVVVTTSEARAGDPDTTSPPTAAQESCPG
jgi:hypothetical protein